MKKIIFTALILSLLVLVGCQTESTSTSSEQEKASESIVKSSSLSTKEPSEMVLEVSDFPSGWTLVGRAERTKSDVSEKGLGLGWKKGYTSSFGWISADNIFIWSQITQYISVYPIENMENVMEYKNTETKTFEELSNPNLGDGSKAYKITKVDEFGDIEVYYQIVFYKKDVMMTLGLDGTTQDYELLKEITKKAERKIK